MKSYQIVQPDAGQTQQILGAFPRAADLEPALQSVLVTARVSVLASSTFERIADVPFSYGSRKSLVDHTNDVTEAGLGLLPVAEARWGWQVNRQNLLAMLLLHDLDKPLLMESREGDNLQTPAAARIPHGVLGAFLLAELGLDEAIVSAVATHAHERPIARSGSGGHDPPLRRSLRSRLSLAGDCTPAFLPSLSVARSEMASFATLNLLRYRPRQNRDAENVLSVNVSRPLRDTTLGTGAGIGTARTAEVGYQFKFSKMATLLNA